jgi:hypothetical protein
MEDRISLKQIFDYKYPELTIEELFELVKKREISEPTRVLGQYYFSEYELSEYMENKKDPWTQKWDELR